MGAGLELGYAGAKVSAKFDISMVNEAISSSSELHKEVDIVTMGSKEFPVPIKVRVKPIISPIVEVLFDASEWSDIEQKRTNLDRALREYPVNRQAGLSDGNINFFCSHMCFNWYTMLLKKFGSHDLLI